MSVVKKNVQICGFWFFIEFEGETGVDQHGAVWIDPENPRFRDEVVLNRYLDAYNEINKKLNIKA